MWVVGGVDHDAVLKQISEDSGWSGRYAFLVVISAMISLLGLLMPSVAVLIGAMLLSPLMMPIIGLGFGIATVDPREIRRSATALLVGAMLAIALWWCASRCRRSRRLPARLPGVRGRRCLIFSSPCCQQSQVLTH